MILSVSKAINSLHGGRNDTTVFAAQKSLAEFAGMIHKGYLLHLTVADSLTDHKNNVGNKIAILSGDYFISKACLGLASLQNTHVSLSVCLSVCMYVCMYACSVHVVCVWWCSVFACICSLTDLVSHLWSLCKPICDWICGNWP